MLTLLTSDQIRNADKHIINTKPISSIDLMEAAARAFVSVFKEEFKNLDESISVYCGTGNNGGDGLAIARLLKEEGYDRISLIIAPYSDKSTSDFEINFQRLEYTGIPVKEILKEQNSFPPESASILIDALLGSGLNKPLEGELKRLVGYLNALQKTVVSVDVPTGFFSEGKIDLDATVMKANLAITFQRPKLNFFFPESAKALDTFKVIDIGLDENFIQSQPSGWRLVEEKDIAQLLKPRKKFTHKGTYGHALIIAGNKETMGAALLCADACLHSGAGLTTAYIPEQGLLALNTHSPEIMALIREDNEISPKMVNASDKFQAIAIGPGLGKDKAAVDLVKYVLDQFKLPMVLDADAINIIADNPTLFKSLQVNSILTPHVKEFDRMFGEHMSWWERVETARKKASEYQVIIILKNQYSFIALPDGLVLINPTGNPAMAVGGMGDVLTGMIAAFLAQGYKAEYAAMLACFLHGQAGDELKYRSGMFTIPPRYIIKKLPEIINRFA